MATHAVLAALILRQPAPQRASWMSPQKPLEFELRARLPLRQPEPPLPPPRAPPARRLSSPAPAPRERLRRLESATAPSPDPQVQPEAPPPSSQVRDLRTVDLLPRGVLRKLSEEGSPAEPPGASRRPGEARRPADDARLAQDRVQGFLDTELARNRVKSGLVDPIWRDLEAGIREQFKPSESLVRSGQTSMSLGQRLGNQVASIAKQILGSPGRVEQGTLPRGEFAERGPMGLPENGFRTGLAAQQSKAVVDAWKKPASWRRTEVELVISSTGEIESLRVSDSCGVKKLDAQAVEAVARAAGKLGAAYRGKRTITTWAVESAYAANVPVGASVDEIGTGAVIGGIQAGFRFDETGLGRKNARGLGKYLSDPEYLVGGQIHTRVSLLSLREPPE